MFFNFFKKEKKPEIFLHNTLTKKKDLFKPIKAGSVGMYTCGPTVYNFPHIGNMRTFLFEDILKRVLIYNDYKVNHVMNITDVGHLTNDSDNGIDKVEMEAKKEGKTAWEIAEFYTKAFKEDLKRLNIIVPDELPKATEHIKEQIDLIQKLEEKGFTYKTSDGIYFDTSKVPDYGKLSGQKLADLKEGARIEVNLEKKNHTDFALWKLSVPSGTHPEQGEGSRRQMEWQSPWGVGFPGWHIECSAMSLKYLGEHFDIHCGGIDHINIHHTNEIAQTESAIGKKPWVNYWIHGAFLNISGGEKMAKSTGNFLTIENTFVEKNINPLTYRFAILMTHYRKMMEWNDDTLISAENGLKNLYGKIENLEKNVFASGAKQSRQISLEWKNKFIEAVNDDLNMPQAMGVLNEMLKSDLLLNDKLATAYDFDKVLGLEFENVKKEEIKIPKEVQDLVDERKIARAEKNWKKSDELRDQIAELGFEVKDTSEGQKVRKI